MFFFLFERAEAKLATLSSCSPRNNQFPPSSSLLLDIPQVRSKSHCGLSVDTRLPARANWMEKKSERAIERRRERALAASLDCKTTASISHREEPKAGPLQNSLSSLSSSFSFFFPHANDLDTNHFDLSQQSAGSERRARQLEIRARVSAIVGVNALFLSNRFTSTPSQSNLTPLSQSVKDSKQALPFSFATEAEMIKRVIVSTLLVGCVALGKERGGNSSERLRDEGAFFTVFVVVVAASKRNRQRFFFPFLFSHLLFLFFCSRFSSSKTKP